MMDVAMCIPTYNRAEVVEDTLGKGIEGYAKMGIDLYYFDSSPDDSTKKVVEKYINSGYSNIHYVAVADGENKGALYFSGEGLEKKYDYIWPVKDRVWFEEPALVAIEGAMREGFDVIFLGVLWCFSHPGIGTKIYEKPEEFYEDWGYLVTSMDVTILNRKSMLDHLSYEDLNVYIPGFAQYELVFQQLVRGNKKIKALVGREIIAFNSNMAASGWKQNVFSIWKENWIKVNQKLPDYYNDYKDIVIKQAGTLPWIFGTVNALLEYKEVGALVPEKLDSILENWERVSDIPKEKVIAIACDTYDMRHDLDLVPKEMDDMVGVLLQLHNFIKSGMMRKEQIPIDSVFQGIMNKVVRRYEGNNDLAGVVAVIAGSIEDTLKYIRDEAQTPEELANAIQMLISFAILAA